MVSPDLRASLEVYDPLQLNEDILSGLEVLANLNRDDGPVEAEF